MQKRFFVGIVALDFIGGCTTLPPMQEATGGIPVSEIVLRTKCELSDAFRTADRHGWLPDEDPKFQWLADWTAQFDLTLQIADSASLSPGATFMEPFHNAYPAVGPSTLNGTSIAASAQSFAIAGGAGLSGQATRIETMTYVISLAELKSWRAREDTESECAISDAMDLSGRLGLREWVREALSPVAREGENVPEYLYAGYHPKPNTTSAQPKSSAAMPPGTPGAQKHALSVEPCTKPQIEHLKSELSEYTKAINIREAISKLDAIPKQLKSLITNAAAATKNFYKVNANSKKFEKVLDPALATALHQAPTTISNINKYSKAIESNYNALKGPVNQISGLQMVAQNAVSAAETGFNEDPQSCGNKVDDAQTKLNSLGLLERFVNKNLELAKENMVGLSSEVGTLAAIPKEIDPPIVTIGQSVQFILSYSGGVSPTWTFVRFKGPTNPLFSASGVRTHMLIISIGPSVAPAGASAVAASQNNMLFEQLLKSPPF